MKRLSSTTLIFFLLYSLQGLTTQADATIYAAAFVWGITCHDVKNFRRPPSGGGSEDDVCQTCIVAEPVGAFGNMVKKWKDLQPSIPFWRKKISSLKHQAASQATSSYKTLMEDGSPSPEVVIAFTKELNEDKRRIEKEGGMDEMKAHLQEAQRSVRSLEGRIEKERPGLVIRIPTLSFYEATKHLREKRDYRIERYTQCKQPSPGGL